MVMIGVMGIFANLTNSLYNYLMNYNQLIVMLVYLFAYSVFGFFISKVEKSVITMNMDIIPSKNTRIRYGKDKNKHTLKKIND